MAIAGSLGQDFPVPGRGAAAEDAGDPKKAKEARDVRDADEAAAAAVDGVVVADEAWAAGRGWLSGFTLALEEQPAARSTAAVVTPKIAEGRRIRP